MPKEFIQEIRSYVRNDAIDIHVLLIKKSPKKSIWSVSDIGNVTLIHFLKLFIQKGSIARKWGFFGRRIEGQPLQMLSSKSLTGNSLNPKIQEPYGIEERSNLVYRELTEKDLSTGEKKVFGRIIDMWAAETPEDPYSHSTEAKLIKHAKEDDLSSETVQEILRDLEAKGLIRRNEENGETFIKYTVEAEHIVKELQKTTYVYEARHFKPPHH